MAPARHPRRVARPSGWAAVWVVAALVVADPAGAQVNVETLRRDPDAPGWSGLVEASVGLAAGNLERVDLGGKGQVQHQTLHPHDDPSRPPFPRERVLLLGSGAYARLEGVTAAAQAFAHVRSTSMWHPRVGSEVYAQIQRDEFLRLKARAVSGVAARFAIVHGHVTRLDAGTGPMLEYERYLEPEELGARAWQRAVRWSSFAMLRLATEEKGLVAQSTTYFQPRVDDPTDLRILSESQLDARIVGDLSLGVRLSVLHDTRPPPGIEPTDVRATNVLKLEL